METMLSLHGEKGKATQLQARAARGPGSTWSSWQTGQRRHACRKTRYSVTDFWAVLLQGAVLRRLSVTEVLGSSDDREPAGAGRSPRRAPIRPGPLPGTHEGLPLPGGGPEAQAGQPLSQHAERTLLHQESSLARPPPAGLGGEPGPQPAAGNRRPAPLRAPRRGSGSAPGRLGAPAAGTRGRGRGRGPGPGRAEVCGPQPERGAQAGPAAARSLSPPPPPPPLPGSAILIPAPSLLPLLLPSSAPWAARPRLRPRPLTLAMAFR